MRDYLHFYIGGQWVDPVEPRTLDVIDPATEQVTGRISIGSSADVDRAVAAASAAGPTWAETPGRVRLAALERILAEFEKRVGDLATAITEEMGAPSWLAERFQAPLGLGHFKSAIRILKEFSFEEDRGTTRIVMEPIIEVARTAAATVKRVHQELGGKSPNIILEDADLEAAVSHSVGLVMQNSGQSCRAPTRMLVPNRLLDEASRIEQGAALDRARRVAGRIRAGYISINDAGLDLNAPFGGYKQSGNGREFGDHAFMEFLELKSVLGYSAA